MSDDFALQFGQALDNVLAVVREAGGGPESIGRLTIYVTDKGEYLARARDVGAVYRARMGRHFPAMALVEVKSLLEDGREGGDRGHGAPVKNADSRLALSVWVRLLKAHGLLLREVRRRVPDALTLPQFDVLAQLHRSDEGMTPGELTRELLVTAGNVTGIVERLSSLGPRRAPSGPRGPPRGADPPDAPEARS